MNDQLYIPEIKFSVSFDKKVKKSQLYKITTSRDAYAVLSQVFSADTIHWVEEVIVLFLGRRNTVLGYAKIAVGGVAGVVIDPKVVFSLAMNVPGTASIMVAHNHPSGNMTPSREDRDMAKKLEMGGKFLDMPLVDFYIISDEDYFSFRDNGLM